MPVQVSMLAHEMAHAAETFHLKHVPHKHVLVLCIHPTDVNLILAWHNELVEPVVAVEGVVWWGEYQLLSDPTVPIGLCRVLIDGSTL